MMWNNVSDTFVDVFYNRVVHFISESGLLDFYLLSGETPLKVS